jgi:hypothetical protein
MKGAENGLAATLIGPMTAQPEHCFKAGGTHYFFVDDFAETGQYFKRWVMTTLDQPAGLCTGRRQRSGA